MCRARMSATFAGFNDGFSVNYKCWVSPETSPFDRPGKSTFLASSEIDFAFIVQFSPTFAQYSITVEWASLRACYACSRWPAIKPGFLLRWLGLSRRKIRQDFSVFICMRTRLFAHSLMWCDEFADDASIFSLFTLVVYEQFPRSVPRFPLASSTWRSGICTRSHTYASIQWALFHCPLNNNVKHLENGFRHKRNRYNCLSSVAGVTVCVCKCRPCRVFLSVCACRRARARACVFVHWIRSFICDKRAAHSEWIKWSESSCFANRWRIN